MKPWKQLLRQPLRGVAIVLLLTMASAFFSLSFGMLFSAKATEEAVERQFVTIALPSNEMMRWEEEIDGHTYGVMGSVITPEIREFLRQLPETCPGVKGAYRQQFISAWCPSLATLTSAQEDGHYRWWLDAPYNCAMFVVTVTDVGEPAEEPSTADRVFVYATGTVEETVLLHPGYVPRSKLNLCCSLPAEELEAAHLEVGGRYLVYCEDYVDADLRLRTDIAGFLRCSVDEVDWSDISYDFLEDTPQTEPPIVAWYFSEEKGGGQSLNQNDLDAIGAGSVIVQQRYADLEYYPIQIDGSEGKVSISELVVEPAIVPLEGSVEAFLETPEGAEWKEVLEQARIRQQCVPVLGTDFLESMYLFQQKEAFLVEGRAFTQEEYRSGKPVCVISEALALSSGLSLGDSLDLRFYWGADPSETGGDMEGMTLTNLCAQPYSSRVGFTGDSQTYEIIGIYRQSNLWEADSYSVTPNTVIVPNASLAGPCLTREAGVLYTLVLENGGIEAVEQALRDQGYSESVLVYFDSGYGEISGTLESFRKSTVQLFAAACVTWVTALAAYLALFVFRQRRSVGLMLSLGAGKRAAKDFIWRISMLPAAFGAAVGAALGMIFLRNALQSVFASAKELLGTDFSTVSAVGYAAGEQVLVARPDTVLVAALLQLLLFALSLWLSAAVITRRSPLDNLRAKSG